MPKVLLEGIGALSYVMIDEAGPGENIKLEPGDQKVIEFKRMLHIFGDPRNPNRCNLMITLRREAGG